MTALLNWARVRWPQFPDSNRRKVRSAADSSASATLVWNRTFRFSFDMLLDD